MAPEAVRAGMVIRLNTLLSGAAGVHPAVVEQYVAFLNAGIVPVVPSRGTVGEADITLAAHIGLVMAGEWEALYRGQRLGAAAALKAAGLAPLRPVGKDFLAILSTNAVVAGDAVLALDAAARYLDRQTVLYALALEGFNGNVAPFLEITTQARPYPGMVAAAADVRALLAGSSLWQPSPDRALQDPLSYRTMAYTLGNVLEAIEEARRVLALQINHSDDNPLVALAPSVEVHAAAGQVRGYVVPREGGGAIYPTANFEPLPFVAAVERLSLALAKLSQALTMTIIRLENPALTGLPRFLAAPGNAGHAFGAVQKSCAALNAENRMLAMPVSLDTPTLAGTIEDTATNSQLAVANLRRIVANLYQIASLQLLHAAQAVDLRPGFALGAGTHPLHAAYRRLVPFVQEDRIFTRDIACGAQFLQTWRRQQAEVALAALPACAR
jgi:histidine ammonia-lyase